MEKLLLFRAAFKLGVKKKLTFKIFRKNGILACFLVLVLNAEVNYAYNWQPHLVSGVVTDGQDLPIPGVTVVEKGTGNGTTTDFNGKFSIQVSSQDAILVFSFIGMTTVERSIGDNRVINIQMDDDLESLNEVVIVGYGKQEKQTVTGAIVSVGNDAIVQTPVSNVSNALVGRAAGLSAVQSSGEPGDNAATIRIRGVGTLNGSGQDPLVIIDGVQSTFEIMNAIDANTIEEVSILKDASATAVYGVRGANGVIIVTTKRGRTGEMQINFSSNFGLTELASQIKMLNSYDYALFRNEAIRMDNDPSFNGFLFTEAELWKFKNNRDFTPAELSAMNLTSEQEASLLRSPALYFGSHDWIDEVFGGLAPQQQYNVNISGGTEKVRYFNSVGYFSQDGVFKNTQYGGGNTNSFYERYNFRSNFDMDILSNLEISVDLAGRLATRGGILGQEADGPVTAQYGRNKIMLAGIYSSAPYIGPGIVDGHLVTGFVNNTAPLQGKGGGGFSPMAYLLTRPYLTRYDSNLNVNVKLNHTLNYLTKGLNLSGTISYNGDYTKGTHRHTPIPGYTATRNPANPAEVLFFGGAVGPASVSDNNYNAKWRQLYLETALNYDRIFKKHKVTGLLLFNAQKTYDPGLLYNVPAGLMGIAGRTTYNYDERYLAEANIGYNGSENFPEGNRFGLFPAFSAGWILSNESFFPTNDWVTWLKVRGSYGEVGNDQIGGRRFLYLPSTWGYGGNYGYGGYRFGNSSGGALNPLYTGATESAIGNPDVTWERARKSNIGIEARFLNDRLSLTGDVFREKRDNILWSLGTVPGIVGADLPPANIGKVKNEGFEIQAGWSDYIGEVEYGISGHVSYAKNTIEFMDEPENPYPWMNSTGFSIGQYKGLVTDGFYNTEEEAANHPYSNIDGNRVQPGDIRYVDINGDGRIDTHDNVPIGYSNIPRYTFGSTLEFRFKGFSFSALFTGSAQGSFLMDNFYLLNPFYMTNGAALEFQYQGRWTPEKVEQGITPTYPRASLRTFSTQNGLASDFWIKSTDHIRLKNIEIGYTFSSDALAHVGIKGMRLYANGNNLYTWSDMIEGFDPEQQSTLGASFGYVYPMTRVYNVGFNVQF